MKKIEGENIVGCIFYNSFTLWDVCFWIHKKEFKLNYGAYVFEFLYENTIAIGLSNGGIEIIHLETGSSLYPRIELCSGIILNLVKICKNIITCISNNGEIKIIDPITRKCYSQPKLLQSSVSAIAKFY